MVTLRKHYYAEDQI